MANTAPSTHSVHALLPGAGVYLPLTQSVHVEAATWEYVPAMHLRQKSPCVAPVVPENRPAAHSVQTNCLVVTWYLPGSQSIHVVVPVFGWYSPATQCVHALLGVLSFLVNSPDPHVSHALLPVSTWYFPLLQFEHALAPDPETVPLAQSSHVFDVAATAVQYLPARQPVQASLLVVVLNLPASQAVHGPPSGPL
jgi:hypothetical protein